MSYLRSNAVKANRPAIDANQAGDTKTVYFELALTEALELNDILGLCKLPAGHMPVDCLIHVTDLDTGTAAIVLDAGFWKNDSESAPTVVNADAMVDGSTAGQAGGLITPNVGDFLNMTPPTEEYIFGLLVKVAPDAGAETGTVKGWFSYRPIGLDD